MEQNVYLLCAVMTICNLAFAVIHHNVRSFYVGQSVGILSFAVAYSIVGLLQ